VSWRESQAGALDEQAAELDAALHQLEQAHDVLEARGRGEACTELRATASMLRGEASAIRSEASELRVTRERPAGFPMALTTRHVRRRPDTREEDDRDRDDLRAAGAAAAEQAR
jgi:hypothetical protein